MMTAKPAPPPNRMNSAAVLNEIPPSPRASARPDSVEVQRFISRPHFVIRHTVAANCEFQPHSHTSFTVVAVLGGQMSAMIADRPLELSEGAIALLDVGQAHSARSSDVEFISIGINPVLVNEL